MNEPVSIYPGQKAQIGVDVKDVAGKPVAGVDLTVYGLTKKFKEAYPPRMPDFSRTYRSRKLYNSFTLKKKFEESGAVSQHKLDWPDWKNRMGLDSLTYYQFLYPKNGVFRYSLPITDKLPQIAPFVVNNGAIEQVNMLFIDDVPVYFRVGNPWERYSFPIDSGYHQLRMRTMHDLLTIDSVYVRSAEKLILSVDRNAVHKNSRIDSSLTNKLNERELGRFNYHLMPIRQSFSNQFAYIRQGRQVLPLNLPGLGTTTKDYLGYNSYQPYNDGGNWGNSGTRLLMGPVRSAPALLVQKVGFETIFTHEYGFEYDFTPGLLKMRSHSPLKSYGFNLLKINPVFRELAWTEAAIDSLYLQSKQ